MELEDVLEEVGEIFESIERRTLRRIRELGLGEIAEFSIIGWVKRHENGYGIDIWRGVGKARNIGEYVDMVEQNREFLDLYSKSLNPTKIKILLLAYDGISEGELSEKIGLRGGALHYHLKDLLMLGLLERTGRGKYRTTKYGSFVIRSAISAIRKFKESVREED